MAEAAVAAGREAGDADLVAVSKTHSAEAIVPVIQAGQRLFGENRVQEAQEKWPDLKAAYPELRLHLIGPLQTNKVKVAVALFDVIETVDRPKLARALAREMEKQDRRLDCFIQVNTGEEEQKAGVWPEEADDFIALVRDELGLSVRGLMCIPPLDEDCSLHFALLREIARRNGLDGLSMGMSADFEVAIRFGATLVRVGTAIFGARKPYP
ncbi:MAG: YggS family pyridoxal phosphate-dependent enzyme [Alphaproteobacteria bacterium]|nr:YggS family pyridoxal phosphate-dependent enzyme [Alphaproteobacteria bacterium]